MNPPPDYVAACERMARILRAFLAAGSRPRFLLPPEDIALVAPLEAVPAIARNDDARAVVRMLVDRIEGGATLTMLAAVLEHCRVPYERAATLAELGLRGTLVPLSKGGAS